MLFHQKLPVHREAGFPEGDKQQTDITTCRLHQPSSRFSETLFRICIMHCAVWNNPYAVCSVFSLHSAIPGSAILGTSCEIKERGKFPYNLQNVLWRGISLNPSWSTKKEWMYGLVKHWMHYMWRGLIWFKS